MKKIYLISLVFAAVILMSANYSDVVKPTIAENAILIDSLEPILPAIPFDYDIDFPDYVAAAPCPSIDPVAINENISPEGATLGRVLFYDNKLSNFNEIACANCHLQEFSFSGGAQFSQGVNFAMTLRNSPGLNDVVWSTAVFFNNQHMLFWDARETVLEEMVLLPIVDPGELGEEMDFLLQKLQTTEYYPPLFEAAFGTTEVTPERIGSALAQFINSISAFDTKFDKVMEGTLSFTPEEQMGFDIFNDKCSFCHCQPHFGTVSPMNNGLDSVYLDIGMASWSGLDTDIGKFKTQSLRNNAFTAPYMHDGRFETLEEVIDFYSEGVFPHENHDFPTVPQDFTGFDFTATEKSQLLAFLATLNGESVISEEKWSDPFESTTTATYFLPLEEPILIAPNPFSESTTVTLENQNGDTYVLQLTTLQGRVLKTIKTTAQTVVFQKENYPAGIYLLEIRQGNRKRVEKLVIQ